MARFRLVFLYQTPGYLQLAGYPSFVQLFARCLSASDPYRFYFLGCLRRAFYLVHPHGTGRTTEMLALFSPNSTGYRIPYSLISSMFFPFFMQFCCASLLLSLT